MPLCVRYSRKLAPSVPSRLVRAQLVPFGTTYTAVIVSAASAKRPLAVAHVSLGMRNAGLGVRDVTEWFYTSVNELGGLQYTGHAAIYILLCGGSWGLYMCAAYGAGEKRVLGMRSGGVRYRSFLS